MTKHGSWQKVRIAADIVGMQRSFLRVSRLFRDDLLIEVEVKVVIPKKPEAAYQVAPSD